MISCSPRFPIPLKHRITVSSLAVGARTHTTRPITDQEQHYSAFLSRNKTDMDLRYADHAPDPICLMNTYRLAERGLPW